MQLIASQDYDSWLGESGQLAVCGGDTVSIVRPTPDGLTVLWQWRAADCPEATPEIVERFRSTDECKPVNGGRELLITSSSRGGCAWVDIATKKTIFFGSQPNAHSAALLPQEVVVVAASYVRSPDEEEGNRLSFYHLQEPTQPLAQLRLPSAHGVVWDSERQRLWALGYDQLLALEVRREGDSIAVEVLQRFQLAPHFGGHDLYPSPDLSCLWLSGHAGVLSFHPSSGQFESHPHLGSHAHVKSLDVEPETGQLLFVQADEGAWWASRLRFHSPSREISWPHSRLYKARWRSKP